MAHGKAGPNDAKNRLAAASAAAAAASRSKHPPTAPVVPEAFPL